MDKTKEGVESGKGGRDAWGQGGEAGGKGRQLYLNNNKIFLNGKKKRNCKNICYLPKCGWTINVTSPKQ